VKDGDAIFRIVGNDAALDMNDTVAHPHAVAPVWPDNCCAGDVHISTSEKLNTVERIALDGCGKHDQRPATHLYAVVRSIVADDRTTVGVEVRT